jgi:hypothetical protein
MMMLILKASAFLLLMAASAADIAGKWNFVWQTEGGERRSTLTFTLDKDNSLKVDFPGAREPMQGVVDGDELKITGSLYSAEVGATGAFRLTGTVNGKQIKGSASWNEHPVTFQATKAE